MAQQMEPLLLLPMNNKLEAIKEEIKALHDKSSNECMSRWFYHGHVLLVAHNAKEIAKNVGANGEIVVLASLFHDIARTWGVYNEPDLMNESLIKTEEIMKRYDYSHEDIEKVKEAILSHSCHEKIPQNEEGKVLATADALAHFLSDFYCILPFYGWLTAANSFEEYRSWLLEKIERDMHKKIFYDEYKEKAKPKYEALKVIFSLS